MKKKIYFQCKKCKHINKPIKNKSNKNWNIINPKCDKCGGDLDIKINDLGKKK